MKVCPNINDKNWIELEKSVGKFRAYRLFISNNYQIPEVENIEVQKERDSKVLTDIKDRLTRVRKVLKNKVNNEATRGAVDKLGELEKKLEKLNELEAIQQYIVSASEIVPEYEKLMNKIKSEPNNLDNIDLLTFIDRFLGTFSNLSDLQKEMFTSENQEEEKAVEEWESAYKIAVNEGREGEFLDSEYGKNKPINTTKVLDDTVKRLEIIHNDYKNIGRNLLAQSLFSQYSEEEIATKKELKEKLLKENPKDAYALSLATTWQELAEQLKEASRDIDSYERWLTSAIGGSTNDFIALVAKKIKDNESELVERLRYYEEKLGKAFEKYAKSSGIDKNNVAKFNEPFIEVVTHIDAKGNEIKTKEFITEFNMEEFSNSKSAFYHTVKDLRESNIKLYNKKWAEWNSKHTQPKSNADKIIEARKESMSEFEFEEWSKKNYSDYNGKRTYKGELVEPGAYYRKNNKVSKLTLEQQEYFKVLKEVHEEIKLLLPKDKAEAMGNMIPTVYKGDWEFKDDKQFKKIISDKLKMNEGDVTYELVDLSGKQHREIPFHFTAKMDADITSSDILQSLLKAAKSWERGHMKMKIMSEIQLAQDLASYGNLKVNKTNAKDENKIDPLSSVDNYLTKEGETNLQNRLDEVIKDLYYGIEEELTLVSTPFGEVSADKVVSNALKVTSMIQLAGNWISGSVNAIMGNLNNLVEAHSGEFVGKRNLAKGLKVYSSNLHHFISDRGKLVGKHWMTKLVEDYDLLHGDYMNAFGENVSGNKLKKEIDSSALMFLQTGAEHQINITNGLAFLDGVKWIDGAFINKKSYKGDSKTFNESKSLLDFFIENEGKLPAEQAEKWTTKDRQRLKNQVHEVNKYVHGNYASEDRTGLQRRWYGKLAMMFRKYVVPGFARRYGKARYNTATGTIMEGYYRSSFNGLRKFFVDLVKESKEVGFKEAFNSTNMDETQKANLRRMGAEVFILGTILALVMALTPDDDEEKNTYWENVALLVSRRMQSEVMFYMNPSETWRILKTPAVSMSTVDSMVDFTGGLLFKYGEDEVYSRNTGLWEKGDSKDLARLVKLIPVLKGVLAGTTPEEQLKVFNR